MKRTIILLLAIILGSNAYGQRIKFKTDVLYIDFNKNEQVEPNEINTYKNVFKVRYRNLYKGGNKMYADLWIVSKNEPKQHYQAEYSDVKVKEILKDGHYVYLVDSDKGEHLLMFYKSNESNVVSILDADYFIKCKK